MKFAVVILLGIALQCSATLAANCKQNGTVFDCSNRSLTSIPTEISDNATVIDLSLNNFGNLTGNFSRFTQLKQLNLTSSKITKVEADAFKGCSALKTLWLSNNDLAALDPNLFKNVTLTSLDLSFNNFNSIPAALKKLESVQNLGLAHLGDNVNVTLKDTFKHMTSLKALSLSGNGIKDVSDAFFADVVATLKTLDLSQNELKSLPNGTFAKFVNATVLDLSHNEIATINDDAFNGMATLVTLNLAMNQLATVRDNFCTATPRLEQLYLCGYQGEALSSHVLQDCTNLKEFHMSSSKLQKVGTAFTNLPKLTILKLGQNFEMQLDSDKAFENTTNLETLDLNGMAADVHTTYYSLPPAIRALKKLKRLDLSYSRFTTFTKADTTFFKQLTYLNVTQNPFNCACKNIDWLVWFQNGTGQTIPAAEKASYNCTTCDQCTELPTPMQNFTISHCTVSPKEEHKKILEYALGSALAGLFVGILLTSLVVFFMLKTRRGCFAGVSYGGLSESA